MPPRTRFASLILVLVVGSCITWRRGVYFSGSFDPVAVAKAGISALALVLAFLHVVTSRERMRVGIRTASFLLVYIAGATFGALDSGTFAASSVLAVRVLIIGAAVYLLMLARPGELILIRLTDVATVYGVTAGVTGLGGSGFAAGRLEGGIIPLHPNEIVLLCGLGMLAAVWRMLQGVRRPWDPAVSLLLAVLVWYTGSRTGLAALVVAMAVLLVRRQRIPVTAVIVVLVSVPVVAYTLMYTGLIAHLLDRGGTASVTTLSSRTVAWTAALHFHTEPWGQWFGSGLSVVKIPVVAKYRTEQILDSSWVTALVQAGWFGVAVLGFWAMTTAASTLKRRGNFSALSSSVLLFLLIRSFLETGLVDATVPFLAFLIIGIGCEPGRGQAVVARLGGNEGPWTSSVRLSSRVQMR